MSKVLVTRPGQDGEALCALLAEAGIESIHHPLIRIEKGDGFTDFSLQLKSYDVLIAVSQHAIFWANLALHESNQGWPQKIRYFAIGAKTAQSLQKHLDSKVVTPCIAESEYLLKLPDLQNVAQQRILIIRGNGGRDLIRQTLVSRGASVDYCDIYRRIPLPLSPNHVQHWVELDISHLVITSGQQLAYLVKHCPSAYTSWLKQRHLFVPSQRIAQQAKAVGFLKIINTGSAANPVLLDCISGKSITG